LASTREILESALKQNPIDEDNQPVQFRLLPPLTSEEVDEFSRSLISPLSEDVRDLLQFCSGIDGALDQIDFTGRTLQDAIGLDFLIPHGLPIAHDGYGNFWISDLTPGSPGVQFTSVVTTHPFFLLEPPTSNSLSLS
jgi:hypothetical protein